MTTEYHDDVEDDSNSFWNKGPAPAYFTGVSRFRRWLFPALTATIILTVIIALGASNTSTWNRLWSVETSLSNQTGSLSAALQVSKDAAKDVHRLKFAVENNKDQLTSVAEALKQLSTLDVISKTVASLKCSLERIINNSSGSGSCCALNWDSFGSSCYFFSRTALTWDEAKDWCNAKESHLVIIVTDEEWDFVTKHSMGALYWVGLSDERTGHWEWVNQTPYVMNRSEGKQIDADFLLDYKHVLPAELCLPELRWQPGQPDAWTGHGFGHGNEDCAHLHNNGKLNDLHCLTKLHFICQRHGGGS